MKQINKGTVDYDYDRYGRRIRKYVVTDMKKYHGKYQPTWKEVTEFTPEREIPVDRVKKK